MTLSFQSADIFRGADRVIKDFDWSWDEGQHWLLTGPVGSGKTTIAEAIMSKCRTQVGGLSFFENGTAISKYEALPYIQYLAFTESTHQFRFGDFFYYQQRYQATESEAGLTTREYLFGKNKVAIPAFLAPLNLEPLLDRRIIQLSNGQTRRTRLAKSLLGEPKMLILEEVFTGIDQQTTGTIERMLENRIVAGTSILLIGDYSPSFITHVLELEGLHSRKTVSKETWLEKGKPKEDMIGEQLAIPELFLQAPEDNNDWIFQDAIRFDKVAITYQKKVVIENLDWQVKKGEKWMLSGANGSGKSSAISLIFADNPQAYAQNIVLFDQTRGSGESIWDIKRKIGFISPELQTYMRSRRNAVDIAAAGYTNTMILSRKLRNDEINLLRQLFDYFAIRHLAKKPFMDLSTGEQRLILFIRAVINNSPLLILDEPFHAMDRHFHYKCLQFLTEYCHPDRTLIYVSHLQEPPPAFITHELKL